MFLGVFFLITQMRLAGARNAILDKLEESSATLREMLATQLTEEVAHVFERFAELLTPLQCDLQQREQDAALRAERLRRQETALHELAAKVG